MYIKEISIKGFRTYRDPCVFRFSPGYNVIVGLNGSGKSNVLLAVTFALAENLEHTNRTCYLYRGDETALDEDFSAHVEVVFDISHDVHVQSLVDNKADLRLKRVFSRSKDLYLVNGKSMSRKDYRQFIESVNLIHFSKQSASYRNDLHFIVKQGAVGKICNMTVEERLTAFRDIIGHRAFDCKIEECAKLLQDYQVMANSVDGQLSQITRKIESLDLQKGESHEWVSLDAERRVLLAKLLITKIAQLKDEMSRYEKEEGKQQESMNSLDTRIDMLEMDLSEIRTSLAIIESMNDLSSKKVELDELETSVSEVNAESSELHKEVGLLSHDKEELNRQLESLNSSIDQTSEELNTVENDLSLVCHRIQDLETKISEVMHKLRSPGEKASEIISRLKKQIEDAKDSIKEEERNKDVLVKSLHRCISDQEIVKSEIARYSDLANEKTAAYQNIIKELEKCTESKRLKQNELSSILIKQSNLRLQRCDAEKDFNKVALSQKETLNMVTQWLESQESVDHRKDYVGIVLGIITVPDAFKVAIEQALGSKLFTIVLRTMASAKSFVRFVEKSNTRYNNIRIVALEVIPKIDILPAFSDLDRNVAMPLVECLTFPDDVKPLIHSLINDYCLVESAEAVSSLTYGRFNCVTTDGQIFYHRGSVSGGYVNVQESVLKLYCALKQAEVELTDADTMVESLGKGLKEMESVQEELSKRRSAAKAERIDCLDKLNQLQLSLQKFKSLEESIRNQMASNKKEALMYQIKTWNEQIEVFKKTKQPSAAEMAGFVKQHEALQESVMSLRRQKASLEAKAHEIYDTATVLREKRNAAAKRMITVMQMIDDYSNHLVELENKASSLKHSRDSILDEYMHACENNERLKQQRDDLCVRLHKVESQLAVYREELGEVTAQNRAISQLLSGIKMSLKEAEDELSRLESDIVSQANNSPLHDKEVLMSKIAELNMKCSKHDLSSRLCTEDCSILKTEYSELKERYDRISRSNNAIIKSIKALKSQKDANLVQMLNQLNDRLTQSFQELVPNGAIRAVLLRREAASLDPSAKLAICLPECFVESPDDDVFTGLDLKVSFGNTSDAMQHLYQLSGGQKTLVSLAFILAVQRLQASPFYLLDEIDAALDESYRVNVTRLLQKQCQEGSQCILTTFRAELLGPGETFYEIRNEGGVSVTRSISLDEALDFITRSSVPVLADQPVN